MSAVSGLAWRDLYPLYVVSKQGRRYVTDPGNDQLKAHQVFYAVGVVKRFSSPGSGFVANGLIMPLFPFMRVAQETDDELLGVWTSLDEAMAKLHETPDELAYACGGWIIDGSFEVSQATGYRLEIE